MSITWLPLSSRKGISQVKIVYEEWKNQKYAGYYAVNSNRLVVVEHPEYEEDIPNIIAHEFRHHIQVELRMFPTIGSYIRDDLEYAEQIKWYFNHFPSEMDALLWSNKVAPCENSIWWQKHLVSPNGTY